MVNPRRLSVGVGVGVSLGAQRSIRVPTSPARLGGSIKHQTRNPLIVKNMHGSPSHHHLCIDLFTFPAQSFFAPFPLFSELYHGQTPGFRRVSLFRSGYTGLCPFPLCIIRLLFTPLFSLSLSSFLSLFFVFMLSLGREYIVRTDTDARRDCLDARVTGTRCHAEL